MRIRLWMAVISSLVLVGLFSFASDQTPPSSYKVIYAFKGAPDGAQPMSDLTIDKQGNLYGTTLLGGAGKAGTVFELKRTKDGWKEQVLYSFIGGSDGFGPTAGVTLDSSGSIYGTTSASNYGSGAGIAFKLQSDKKGVWTEHVIYRFTENGALTPNSDLVFDRSGNLYGTTESYYRDPGILFELSPHAGGSWTETTRHVFSGNPDGASAIGDLVIDPEGNIYGITESGGDAGCNPGSLQVGCGTVYELTPGSSGWTEMILYNFAIGHAEGRAPSGGLVLDKAGDLYGTTQFGGNGLGVLFKLSRSKRGAWQEAVLYRFYGGYYGLDGDWPVGRLAMNAEGIFGATRAGGPKGVGTVFQARPAENGWRELVLHSFANVPDGASPAIGAGVVADSSGAIYGTTSLGGDSACGSGQGCGVVFEVKP